MRSLEKKRNIFHELAPHFYKQISFKLKYVRVCIVELLLKFLKFFCCVSVCIYKRPAHNKMLRHMQKLAFCDFYKISGVVVVSDSEILNSSLLFFFLAVFVENAAEILVQVAVMIEFY